ncbi:alpha/beta fold hydrolase [Paractinoplanes atraurantiacus]|uniref:Pimeloyl-ACP methyl ester carboxylesterase n=1 Tax=Paractinoplanes atraurantiacus TaxID=1036182 RepID=A0A285JUZ8_9ACTN|nr:alpha/beta fold hydrolase [Actinoplanes atraurantiacus]SNY64129.1 Pimeloyl-ACP methyl ester carboxylesterase [Actinoplanes atraurantiacus]
MTDSSTPHSARLWNYWLGGTDNFPVDREAGDAIAAILPSIVTLAQEDRKFLRRSVRHLVAGAGIRQILDIGSGLPTANNTHEVAQAEAPETRVVYVDNDPLVLVHAQKLLTSTPEGVTTYTQADLHQPSEILRSAAETLDFTRPVAVTLLGILHFLGDDDAQNAVRTLIDAVPPGSYLVIAHGCDDINTAEANRIVEFWNERGTPKIQYRSAARITQFFHGLNLLDPGVVPCNRWRPDAETGDTDVNQFCGWPSRHRFSCARIAHILSTRSSYGEATDDPEGRGSMNPRMRRALSLAAVAAVTVAGTLSTTAASAAPAPASVHTGVEPRVPAGFTESKVRVGDVGINYVRGGHGPVLLLVHGYPQTWYEWRDQLPELAKHYTVIAPDLRGAGRSDAPAGGYDKKTMAADLHGLLVKLGLNKGIRLVGHDIGTMVAYAYAAAHPAEVTKLVLSEAPIPDDSIYTFPALNPKGASVWNFGFFSLTNGLPEQLVDGREELWVDRFIDQLEIRKGAVDARSVKEFASYLRDDAHLKASFEWFRAFPKDVKDSEVNKKTKLTMPVLAIGASGSLGETIETQVSQYATRVTGKVIANSGHWIYEEHPRQMTQVLLTFLR